MKGKKKRSDTKPHKAGFGGFSKLTRPEVEWLTKDTEKTLKRIVALPPLKAKAPLGSGLREGSVDKEELLKVEQVARNLRLARAINLVVNAALRGDESCGAFVAEMVPFLLRKESELMANEHFKRRISELRSAQKARRKGRTLRAEIEEIIQKARSQRHLHEISNGGRLVRDARKDLRNLARRAKLLKKEWYDVPSFQRDYWTEGLNRVERFVSTQNLQKLPDFCGASTNEWFENVIWPELHRREPELRANPLIGELKKANKSGKFQLSDLKTQALVTTRRIALLPRVYFFW